MDSEQHIRELIKILQNLGPKGNHVLDPLRAATSDSDWARLYRGFASGAIKQRSEGVKLLIETGGSEKSYASQRNQLQTRVVNSLFALDLRGSKVRTIHRSTYECERYLFLSKILLGLGARNVAIRYAKRAIKIARHCQLTTQLLQILEILKENASLEGDRLGFERLAQEQQQMTRLLQIELQAANEYQKVSLLFARSGSEKPSHAMALRNAIEYLREYHLKENSFKISLNYYRLLASLHLVERNYEATLHICKEARQFLDANVLFADKQRYGEFEIKTLLSLIHLRRHKQAEESARRCDSLYKPGRNNWFAFQEFKALLMMHTGKFDEAHHIYLDVTSHERFATLSEHRQDRWKLLAFFIEYVTIPASNRKTKKRTDSIHRRIARLNSLISDKKGFNAWLLILQILYLLEIKDFPEVIKRVDAVKAYRSRHLLGPMNSQSSTFLKLITIMVELDFNKEKIMHSSKIQSAVLSGQIGAASSLEGYIIMPYDWIWQRVLARL